MHFAIFLLSPLYATVLATHEALKETHWGPVCELAGELNKLPGAARAKLKALRNAEKAARVTALQLSVYAAMQKNNKSVAAIGALAAAVENQAGATRAALDVKTSEFIRATATTSHFAGAVGEAINFLDKIAGPDGTYYCLGTADASAAGRNQIAAKGCVVSSWKYDEQDTKLKEKTYDATSFPKLTEISASSAKGTAGSKCGLFQFGADQNTPIISGTTPNMAAGLIQATNSDAMTIAPIKDLTASQSSGCSPLLRPQLQRISPQTLLPPFVSHELAQLVLAATVAVADGVKSFCLSPYSASLIFSLAALWRLVSASSLAFLRSFHKLVSESSVPFIAALEAYLAQVSVGGGIRSSQLLPLSFALVAARVKTHLS
ncbi:Trypanosome variant surface glycoprotein (A-type) [Trypanosoma brucei equiperdum]|uniref:Trypanosome variant surface glycoprotein (A-type) n=1 Tax=Trypanosoma brucei equiperdum TaxID=630700 RepID=A0A3L6KSG6_9TRYP|nr:Trypanosome variant surface glycoprotein (A-type) [Trypanosoma brucei equiperdum]RHW67392.1 Trypanosome variant surface glycoprotein (A-type) [Trypanosoma brucei equiperdum]